MTSTQHASVPDPTPTLSAWSALHLAYCRQQGRTETTIKRYLISQREFMHWVGSDDGAALSRANARAWMSALRERGLAESTVKLHITCLKVWANWLSDEFEEELPDSPLYKVKLPKVKKPVIEIFTPEQVAALHLAARTELLRPERDTALLYFAFDTMIRSHELRQATIPPAFAAGDTEPGWMTILGKGKKQRRIHYDAATARAVCAYLATRKDKLPWLFLHDRGKQFGEFTFLRILQRLGSRANLRGVRVSPHTMRHTGAVRFLQAYPEHIAQLKMRLGHESLDMTLRYATRATEESVLSDNGTSALDLLGLT